MIVEGKWRELRLYLGAKEWRQSVIIISLAHSNIHISVCLCFCAYVTMYVCVFVCE